jgi:hypothetical protein
MTTSALAHTLQLATLDVDVQEADSLSAQALPFSVSRVMSETWNEVRLRDSGITREHWKVLLRSGVAMLSLGLLVLLVIFVRVMNDGLEAYGRGSERNIRIVQKEHDRLELEAQARRAPQQIDAAISALGLVHSPMYELTADGHSVLVSSPLQPRPPDAVAPMVPTKPTAPRAAAAAPKFDVDAPDEGAPAADAEPVVGSEVVAKRGEIGSAQ